MVLGFKLTELCKFYEKHSNREYEVETVVTAHTAIVFLHYTC